MNLTFKSIFLVCLLPFVHSGPVIVKDTPTPDYNLPDGLWPLEYTLTLIVDLKTVESVPDPGSTYDGKVEIKLDVTSEGVSEVKLHSYETIQIKKASLRLVGDTTELLADDEKGSRDETTNILTIKQKDPNNKLINGKIYVLTLEFQGTYRKDMYGFYKSSYVDADGKVHWLVTTQFESVAARSAFPCFDEPRFKALYKIYVKVKDTEGYHALSNMNLINKEQMDGDFRIFEFDKTPVKLASYLVAFIVSDFTCSNPVAEFNGKKPFRTCGQNQFIVNKEDALSQLAGPAVLDIYKDKLGIEFLYPKIDQVGIPDFNAGAMENWGLTTYRERMLFFNEESNSAATKQSTVAVTAHELAHQWFGDLVTLHSWDDVWLNEGFADYFEYHGSALINKDDLDTSGWNLLGQFVTDEIQSDAFEIDGLESARPLTSPVEKPDEIEANFDSIAYSKGGSVIRMWQHVLTDEIFYAGLKMYLNAHKGGNAKPENLLNAFQVAYSSAMEKPNLNQKGVKELFENWHLSAGYPVLTVQHMEKAKYNLTQERFLWKTGDKKQTNSWHIPISYSTFEKPNFESTTASHWLESDVPAKEITFGDENTEKPTWIIVNNQEAGYYRVNYDEDNWKSLMEELKNNHTNIHEINRAQIIDDALSLARSTQKEYLSYDIALGLTEYLKDEESYLPWSAASNAFSFLNTKLSSDKETYNYFKEHVLKSVRERYSTLGLTVPVKDTHLNRLLRILIASWACKLDDPTCIADAQAQIESGKISPDVKSIVYCTAVRNGNETTWNSVWTEYKTSTNNLDQTIFLSALGCTKDGALLEHFLNMTIEDGQIRKQDLQSAFSSVYNGNPENVKSALEFLKNNMETIKTTYGGTDPVGKLLIGLAAKVVSADDIKTLKEDILKPILASSDDKLKKSAKLAEDSLASTESWISGKQSSIATWLKGQDDNNGGGGGGGAAEITVSVLTVISCLALLFSS